MTKSGFKVFGFCPAESTWTGVRLPSSISNDCEKQPVSTELADFFVSKNAGKSALRRHSGTSHDKRDSKIMKC